MTSQTRKDTLVHMRFDRKALFKTNGSSATLETCLLRSVKAIKCFESKPELTETKLRGMKSVMPYHGKTCNYDGTQFAAPLAPNESAKARILQLAHRLKSWEGEATTETMRTTSYSLTI